MNTRRSLLAAAALITGIQCKAAETTASVTVPASSFVFDGEGLQAPDDAGIFAFGIKLPIKKIKADKCETPYLMAGLGTMHKSPDEYTSADRKIIAHRKVIYADLVAASKAGKMVTLTFRNKPDYLKTHGGVIYAPYCQLSMDEPGRASDD